MIDEVKAKVIEETVKEAKDTAQKV